MIRDISAIEANAMLASGAALLIDVREPDEFKAGHIAYATSLPLGRVADYLKQMNIPSDRKIIFQCQKGGRGKKACVVVQEGGVVANEIYNIDGGIVGWQESGLPVVGASGPRLPIMRQVQIIVGSLVLICMMLGMAGITIGFVLAGVFGGALVFAGVTGWCGLAMLLSHMPWNK